MKAYFYPKSTHTAVVAFADLFNDMSVRVYDSKGEIVGVKPVPATLTPREKIVSILKAAAGINDVDPQVDNYLPRISINMNGMSWDSQRMRGKNEKRLLNIEYENGGRRKTQIDIQPVPYKLTFEVVIWAKYMSDGIQLVENIVPWFAPEAHVSYKERNFGLEHKAKVVLDSITQNHVYEFGEADRRVLQWVLTFTMDAVMWKPMELKPEILCNIISIADVPCRKLPFQGDKIVVYEPEGNTDSLFDTKLKVSLFNLDQSESYDLMTQYWKSANHTMNPPYFTDCTDKHCADNPGPRPDWDPSLQVSCGVPPSLKPCIDIDPATGDITNYWQETPVENNVIVLRSYMRTYNATGQPISGVVEIPNSEYPDCFNELVTVVPVTGASSSSSSSSAVSSSSSAETCPGEYETTG